MSDTMYAEAMSVEFGSDTFRENARGYAEHKRLVDAASRYDSLDDAIAAVTDIWERLESQVADGGGYTPSTDLGFGSDNASQIASAILGRKTSVTQTRKAFASLGK
jgi:hypothetical protein